MSDQDSPSVNPPSNSTTDDKKALWDKSKIPLAICCCVVFGIGSILMISLLSANWSYVEYDELAFRRNNVDNEVDTTRVFVNGRYDWGPGFGPLTFPALFQQIEFDGDDALAIFSENGLEFGLEVDIFYRLNPQDLADIFADFGTAFEQPVIEISESSIRNTAPMFSVDDYFSNRSAISAAFAEGLNRDLVGVHVAIEPFKFALGRVLFPDSINTRFLDIAVQLQINERELIERTNQLIIRETDRLVAEFESNITIVRLSGEAFAETLIENAQSRATSIRQNARGSGVNTLFQTLGASNETTRQRLLRWFEITDGQDPTIFSGEISPVVFNGAPAAA